MEAKAESKSTKKSAQTDTNTLLLAPMDLGQTSRESVAMESLLEPTQSLQIIYLDRQNSQKTLQKAKKLLESKGKVVYMGEVHYGLDAKDFIYEFRIL
ncbi:HP0268 family nuclease [uncultured Helicobacter sp.]|uniref:HP0268 family nuclease n=1 Tax=uncultured Helicobacter sp. TaxID=175537 RepID=UPI00263869D1|nr:HP0268 family nuclease [uncultured Helicobacter sp.]